MLIVIAWEDPQPYYKILVKVSFRRRTDRPVGTCTVTVLENVLGLNPRLHFVL